MKGPKALTIKQLYDIALNECYDDLHIWVKILNNNHVTPAIIDILDRTGIVAVWCATTSKDEWLIEKDYGKTWLAYVSKPCSVKICVKQKQ